MALICSTILYFGLRRENARRDAKYGPVVQSSTTQPRPHHAVQLDEDIDSEEYKEKWGLVGMTRREIEDLGDNHPAHRFIL